MHCGWRPDDDSAGSALCVTSSCRDVALAHFDQLALAHDERHDEIDLVLAASLLAADHVDFEPFGRRQQGDGSETLVVAGRRPLLLVDQLIGVPDPHIVDRHEAALVISAMSAFGRPYAMFSASVPEKITAS